MTRGALGTQNLKIEQFAVFGVQAAFDHAAVLEKIESRPARMAFEFGYIADRLHGFTLPFALTGPRALAMLEGAYHPRA